MSMAWMRMPGQTWPGAAVSFLGMWVAMMVAMMLPSLVPMLWRLPRGRWPDRRAAPRSADRARGRGLLLRLAAFPLGAALAAIEMEQPSLARAVPIAIGVVVLIAGFLQLTAWKARHLDCCREAPGRGPSLAGRRGHRLATRPAPRPSLQPLLCQSDGDPPGHRGHGPS